MADKKTGETFRRSSILDFVARQAPPRSPPRPERRKPLKPGSLKWLLFDAARSLSSPFSAAELAVAAWRKYPEKFGLAGYVYEHPNTHKVFVMLAAHRGSDLVRQGYLHRLGPCLYEVGESP